MSSQQSFPNRHRLHALCPYFAMFPPEFVRANLTEYTKRGDLILDPFSGRGTTLLESLLLGRDALASDINPVAYCVSAAKANVPRLSSILSELDRLERVYARRAGKHGESGSGLPEFFKNAFHPRTLEQMLFLRSVLDWRGRNDHRFLAALALGHLHGESDRSEYYFSNQMPHSISTKPDYSVRYWKKHKMVAPFRDVFEVLHNRAEFRLRDGAPERKGTVLRCDVRKLSNAFRRRHAAVSAVITSPPYLDVTNFEEDQWLRLWFLGGPPRPTYGLISTDDRHSHSARYWDFIEKAWLGILPLLRRKAKLICRIGAKGLRADVLIDAFTRSVTSVWPRAHMLSKPVASKLINSQISVLNPTARGCEYEFDFVFIVQ
jgi:hypothetical protein